MKALIILGNRMNDDGTMSELLEKRINLGVKFFKEYRPDIIIVAGGLANKTAGITEADAMSVRLKELGIPENIIVKEKRSRTTRQNAKCCASLLKRLDCREVTVCTTCEHLYRSYLNPLKLFRRACGRNIVVQGYCDSPYGEYTAAPFIIRIEDKEQWNKNKKRRFITPTGNFVHCCTAEYLWRIAPNFANGNYLLLLIDPNLIDAEIRWEDYGDSGRKYPHVYGKIPCSAVCGILDFLTDNGKFVKNPELEKYADA